MNDLNAIHVFLALMQTRSTQRAATKLGRSQSYVSKVLAQLREDLGDPLFLRNAMGLAPTSYAESIEPKVRNAMEQLTIALEPEEFDPSALDKITIHVVSPYLAHIGKDLIMALRKETQALIELRGWTNNSEELILSEEVDIGVHVINDKPQSFFQKRVHSGAGYFGGNLEGEFVKFIIPGVNETQEHFQVLDPSIEVGIIVDNQVVMDELMDTCFTLRYEPYFESKHHLKLNIDVALITKASLRHSPKQQWLANIIEPIIKGRVESWIGGNKQDFTG
ncbi:LysR family transcriptional regulator [Vibrio sp. 10N.261.55.A7]|uniref:LysR family transcriptional regulator n=1 Tax=Vibrio TaxID=662 RepID=UPI000C832626|nr:LysR family transcriptional regulator [Vibrio sp. 10N.261.55.A7]PMK00589.1 LysR family transcriptional regulator [Vibrio sp. 10N.261.55.A7]